MQRLIRSYFRLTGKVMPKDEHVAMDFFITELAEIFEAKLDTGCPYKRNNPDKKRPRNEDFAEEVGDAIMMLEIATLLRDESALKMLTRKIAEHLRWVQGVYWVEIFDTLELLSTNCWKGDTPSAVAVSKAFEIWQEADPEGFSTAKNLDADLFASGEQSVVVIFEASQISL